MTRILAILSISFILFQLTTCAPTLNSPNARQVDFLRRIVPLKHQIGQVGGLDTDNSNNLLVFHRATRKWSFDSFFFDNFNTLKYGPIKEDVLTLIDPQTMERIDSWGANMFYMPHGLTVDFEQNVWLTDVGQHQVYKFDLNKSDKPLITLGVQFEKGSDEEHFCKPTAVAVSELNRDVFVADGYCNQRVVQFNQNGKFIKEFMDRDVPMFVVHAVALLESEGLVCAASREDGRIVCFDIESGDRRFVITDPSMKTVYAIVYDPINQVIHAATGDNRGMEAIGLTFDASPIGFGKLLQKWSHKSEDLTGVHDIAISQDSKRVYVGQLNGEIDEFTYQ